MKQQTELLIQMVVGFLLLTRPSILVKMANDTLGKVFLVLAVVAAAFQSTLSGILTAMLFIVLSESVIEGMDTKSSTNNDKDIEKKSSKLEKDFHYIMKVRKKHCKELDGKLQFVDDDGKLMTLEEIKKSYKNIQFDDNNCQNPCLEKCDLVVTSYDEQLTNEENLRPKNSKEHVVSRTKDEVQAGTNE